MAEIAITRREFTATELRAAAGKTKVSRAARRMLAIALVLEGVDRTTAAQTCGMDRHSLRDWVHRYKTEGLAGLYQRPVQLTCDQLLVVIEVTVLGSLAKNLRLKHQVQHPRPAGHRMLRWTNDTSTSTVRNVA